MSDMARIVRDGDNYSVELPAEFHFDCERVWISREGNRVFLQPMIEEPQQSGAIGPKAV